MPTTAAWWPLIELKFTMSTSRSAVEPLNGLFFPFLRDKLVTAKRKREVWLMSSGRLFEILYLLLDRKQMTAADLAERFEVSVRTIYRDIDALSAAGIPVCATQGKGGGISLMDHYVLDRAIFSEAEQRALLTALQSLPSAANKDAKETLTKLSGLFRRQETDWLEVDLSRWGSGEADRSKFETIKEAILHRRILRFSYASSYGRSTLRKVLPARMVFKGQGWYLQGFCLTRQDYRTFRVSRIFSLETLNETFAQELSPPPIETSDASGPSCIVVRLRFTPELAYRVYDEFDESCISIGENGSIMVTAALPEDPWLYGYLLSFGCGVEVFAPAEVRRTLGIMAEKIWRNASEHDIGCQVS